MEHCKALHEFNPRSGPAKRLGDITTLGIAQLDQTDIFLGVKKFYIDTGKESGHLGQMYEMMHKHCSLPQPNLDKTTAAVNLYRELGVPNTRFITIDLADPAQSRQNLGL